VKNTNIIDGLRSALGCWVKENKQLCWFTFIFILFLTAAWIAVYTVWVAPEVDIKKNTSTWRAFLHEEESQGIAAILQGTLGVAAAVAGAIVSVFLSLNALTLAQQALGLAQREQDRENEKYAKELRASMVNGAIVYENSIKGLLKASKSTFFEDVLVDLFLARIKVRLALLQDGRFVFQGFALSDAEQKSGALPIEILDYLASKNPERYSESKLTVENNPDQYKTFDDLLNLKIFADAIERTRTPFLNNLDVFREALKRYEADSFVPYVFDEVQKDKTNIMPLARFKANLDNAAQALQCKENWVNALGFARHYSQHYVMPHSFVIDGAFVGVNYNAPWYAMLFVILNKAHGGDIFDVFGLHPRKSSGGGLSRGFSSLSLVFCRNAEALLKVFAMTTKEDEIPRPMQTYCADGYASEQSAMIRDAIKWLIGGYEAIDKVLDLTSVHEENLSAFLDGMVNYWHFTASRHFGEEHAVENYAPTPE